MDQEISNSISLPLNELIIQDLEDHGFNTSSWKYSEEVRLHWDNGKAYWKHKYIIIPGLFRLIVLEDKMKGSQIELIGIPGFELTVSIENPDSLDLVKEKLRKLYIWMKNINSECVKELLNESTGFCSRTDIGDSR